MTKAKDPLEAAMQEAVASVERIARERKGEDGGITVETDTSSDDSPAAAAPPAPEASAETQQQLNEMREQLLRMAADFDNYRKRVRKDQEDLRRYASESLIRELLPVADNLQRALSHSENDDNPVIMGVRMVLKQFTDALQNHGVREFECVGKPFDPERHEAVGQEYDAKATPGTVLREMMRGYTLHERLLRPARVVVAASAPTSHQS